MCSTEELTAESGSVGLAARATTRMPSPPAPHVTGSVAVSRPVGVVGDTHTEVPADGTAATADVGATTEVGVAGEHSMSEPARLVGLGVANRTVGGGSI